MIESSPHVGYWHLWTDADRISHLTERRFEGLASTAVATGAAPVLVESLGRTTGESADLAVLPAGLIGDWHENPRRQWGLVLAGTFFIEAMDGQRVELVAGDLFLGEDQGTHSSDGGRGHRSGTVGDADVVLVMIPVQRAED